MSGALRVYLETTVISYLTARPSRNLYVVAHQQITADWWTRRRKHFDLYVSRLVLDEAAAGDAEAAVQRLASLSGIPLLELTESASTLAANLVAKARSRAKRSKTHCMSPWPRLTAWTSC